MPELLPNNLVIKDSKSSSDSRLAVAEGIPGETHSGSPQFMVATPKGAPYVWVRFQNPNAIDELSVEVGESVMNFHGHGH